MAAQVLLETKLSEAATKFVQLSESIFSLKSTPHQISNKLKDDFLEVSETLVTLAVQYQDYDFDRAKLAAKLVYASGWHSESLFDDGDRRLERLNLVRGLARPLAFGTQGSYDVMAVRISLQRVAEKVDSRSQTLARMVEARKKHDAASEAGMKSQCEQVGGKSVKGKKKKGNKGRGKRN